MTQTDAYWGSPGPGSLDDAVASITGPVARRLAARYVPVYASVAVMLLVAVVAPSRVNESNRASAQDFGTPNELAASTDDASGGTGGGSVASGPSGGATGLAPSTPARAVLAPAGGGSALDSGPVPDSLAGPNVDGATGYAAPEGDPGGFSDDGDDEDASDGDGGFTEGVPPCPVEFGQDPEVSRGVAGVLLSAASPALSALGPFGPNAVPALSLASPILPVVAPVADKFAPYIRMLGPLFLQVAEFGTTLWRGPLQPLEAPLLQLNAAVVQPFEVELLAALAGPIGQVNETPLTPCLQRLVYNLVAPLPTPTP